MRVGRAHRYLRRELLHLAAVHVLELARRMENHATGHVGACRRGVEGGPAPPAATDDTERGRALLLAIGEQCLDLGGDHRPRQLLDPRRKVCGPAGLHVKVGGQAVPVGTALKRRMEELGDVDSVACPCKLVRHQARASRVPTPYILGSVVVMVVVVLVAVVVVMVAVPLTG